MIELKGITKAFDRPVLDEIDYKFNAGKLYVIKGVSGCGKSTLLNILGGIENEYEGQYLFEGSPFKRSHEVAYIFQNSLLMADLSIRDNLLLIKQNNAEIEMYAQRLNITKLLDKLPSQLSGGERQRVSIIRALLLNPKIILADEPTASLDPENSKAIASLITEFISKNRTIIVATHEDCFDEFADEILYLDYGKIKKIEKFQQNRTTYEILSENKAEAKMSIFQYLNKRGKLYLPIKKILSLALILLILLSCVSLCENFSDEYTKMVANSYPLDVFPLERDYYELLKNDYSFKVYENYVFADENVICLALYSKEDSGLSYPGIIQYGNFPKSDNEIIVTKSFVSKTMNITQYENAINKKVEINGICFNISGILSNLDTGEQLDFVVYNPYYSIDGNVAFIPYNNIKNWGQIEECDKVMVKYDNIYNNKALVVKLRELYEGPFSVWDNTITTLDSIMSFVFVIILFIVACAAGIAILFINNEIKLELFYRKREIGYLQIFGVNKKRILSFLISERMVKTTYSIITSIVFFNLMALLCKLIFNIDGFISIPLLLAFVFIIGFYSFCVFYFPCRKFLKQNIIDLIV